MEDAWTYAAPPAGETRFRALEGRRLPAHRAPLRGLRPPLERPRLRPGGPLRRRLHRRHLPRRRHRGGLRAHHGAAAGALRQRRPGRARRGVRRRARAGAPTALDVGSGLCVFLHGLRRRTAGECTALDPDPRAAAHARETVGVAAVAGDFMEAGDLGALRPGVAQQGDRARRRPGGDARPRRRAPRPGRPRLRRGPRRPGRGGRGARPRGVLHRAPPRLQPRLARDGRRARRPVAGPDGAPARALGQVDDRRLPGWRP